MSGPTAPPKSQDRGSRGKLISWMKRLTKSKNNTTKAQNNQAGHKADQNSDPRQEDAEYQINHEGQASNTNGAAYSTPLAQDTVSFNSSNQDGGFSGGQGGNRSLAPTVHTDGAASDTDQYSRATTSQTLTGGGADSTFSSTHSTHSLNTTLTTMQSTPSTIQVPNINPPQNTQTQATGNHSSQPSTSSTYFQHEYPSTPAPAIPPHMNPLIHLPTTYRSATANNLLSDNASVLTLASSSHHRPHRRNSLDTNASIRAIAPSSVWGGSRESLPLSVLSTGREEREASTSSPTPPSTAGIPTSAGGAPRSISGTLKDERSSLYGTGAGSINAPALTSERNSVYTGKSPTTPKEKDADGTNSLHDRASLPDRLSVQSAATSGDKLAGDSAGRQSAGPSSVRSGLVGHGRSESYTGSVGGISSPLAGPSEIAEVNGDGHTEVNGEGQKEIL